MRKGIIFTTDAILALIAVMLFIAWLPYQTNSQPGSHIFENLSEQARDSAVTNFYKDNPSPNSNIDADSEFGKCVASYSIDPSVGPSAIEKNIFCEET